MSASQPERPRILFMGTPEFAVPCLRALAHAGYSLPAVVTQPDRKRGRGRKLSPSPVKKAALELGLEVIQPEDAADDSFCQVITGQQPHVIVVVAFGQILCSSFLDIPGAGVLNIHSSLLPKYRGAAPIQWAVINDETETGLSAMLLDEGMDTGPVLLQQRIPIGTRDTAGTVHDRLAAISGDFLIRALDGLFDGSLRPEPQDESLASYAPKIDRNIACIDWKSGANEISALIRGLDPFPGASTTFEGKRLKLFMPSALKVQGEGPVPGRVCGVRADCLEIETGSGILVVRELQIEGKKRMPAEEFLRGCSIRTGMLLGE